MQTQTRSILRNPGSKYVKSLLVVGSTGVLEDALLTEMKRCGLETGEIDWTRDYREIENIVQRSGIPCTFLRFSWLLENFILQSFSIRNERTLFLPIVPQANFRPLSAIDVGKVTVAMIKSIEDHVNMAYELTGPVKITPLKLAEVASSALEHHVSFRPASDTRMKNIRREHWVDPRLTQRLTDYFKYVVQSKE
ncbi:hypothetical protein HK098_007384, partial [Nowakowskiella sp. JEL0407]